MNAPVTSVVQALGYFVLDSDCPTVYLEVCRNTAAAEDYAPRWVALDLRGKVGRLCGMRHVMRPNNLDEVGVDCPLRWGPSAEEAEPIVEHCRLKVERVGESEVLYLAGIHEETGAPVETYWLEIDQFLIDVANGRRYFGNVLSDSDLEDEVAEHEASANSAHAE